MVTTPKLQQSMHLLGRTRLTLHQFLSIRVGEDSKTSTVRLFPPLPFFSIFPFFLITVYKEEQNRVTVEVHTVSLDKYFLNDFDLIDLMKVDVEGAELSVLDGSRELFKQVRSLAIALSLPSSSYRLHSTVCETWR